MKVTNDLKQFFEVQKGKVYNGYHMPTSFGNKETGTILQWGNPDEEFTAELNLKTMEMKAEYYEWSDEEEDWVDGEPMADEDLLIKIKNREFLAAR